MEIRALVLAALVVVFSVFAVFKSTGVLMEWSDYREYLIENSENTACEVDYILSVVEEMECKPYHQPVANIKKCLLKLDPLSRIAVSFSIAMTCGLSEQPSSEESHENSNDI